MKDKIIKIILGVVLLAGCKYDNEEELYNCSTDVASTRFSPAITSILTSYGCVGCHSGGVPSGGISLENHAGVKSVADNGRLFGAVSHLPGFEPMPQVGGKMSACDIRKLKAWIDAGAPNN